MSENSVNSSDFRSKLKYFNEAEENDKKPTISSVTQSSERKSSASARPKVHDVVRQFAHKTDNGTSESIGNRSDVVVPFQTPDNTTTSTLTKDKLEKLTCVNEGKVFRSETFQVSTIRAGVKPDVPKKGLQFSPSLAGETHFATIARKESQPRPEPEVPTKNIQFSPILKGETHFSTLPRKGPLPRPEPEVPKKNIQLFQSLAGETDLATISRKGSLPRPEPEVVRQFAHKTDNGTSESIGTRSDVVVPFQTPDNTTTSTLTRPEPEAPRKNIQFSPSLKGETHFSTLPRKVPLPRPEPEVPKKNLQFSPSLAGETHLATLSRKGSQPRLEPEVPTKNIQFSPSLKGETHFSTLPRKGPLPRPEPEVPKKNIQLFQSLAGETNLATISRKGSLPRPEPEVVRQFAHKTDNGTSESIGKRSDVVVPLQTPDNTTTSTLTKDKLQFSPSPAEETHFATLPRKVPLLRPEPEVPKKNLQFSPSLAGETHLATLSRKVPLPRPEPEVPKKNIQLSPGLAEETHFSTLPRKGPLPRPEPEVPKKNIQFNPSLAGETHFPTLSRNGSLPHPEPEVPKKNIQFNPSLIGQTHFSTLPRKGPLPRPHDSPIKFDSDKRIESQRTISIRSPQVLGASEIAKLVANEAVQVKTNRWENKFRESEHPKRPILQRSEPIVEDNEVSKAAITKNGVNPKIYPRVINPYISSENSQFNMNTPMAGKPINGDQIILREKLERIFGSTSTVSSSQAEDKVSRSSIHSETDSLATVSSNETQKAPESPLTPLMGFRKKIGKAFSFDRDDNFSKSSLELDSQPEESDKKLKSYKRQPILGSRRKDSTPNEFDRLHIEVVRHDSQGGGLTAAVSPGSDKSPNGTPTREFKYRNMREKRPPNSRYGPKRKPTRRPATELLKSNGAKLIYNKDLILPQVELLIKGEEAYVEKLDMLKRNFDVVFSLKSLPVSLMGKKFVILGNIEQIIDFQSKVFLPMLKTNRDNFDNIIEGFIQFLENGSFYCYVLYNMNLSRALDEISANRKYIQNTFEEPETLPQDLSQPILRLHQYVAFLKAISQLAYSETLVSRAQSLESLLIDREDEDDANDFCGELADILEDFLDLVSSARHLKDIRQCKHYSLEEGVCTPIHLSCIRTNLFVVNPYEQGRLKKFYDFDVESNNGVPIPSHVYCFEKAVIITDAEGIFLDCLPWADTEVIANTSDYFTLYYYAVNASRKWNFYGPAEVCYKWILEMAALHHKVQQDKQKKKIPRKKHNSLKYSPSMCMILTDDPRKAKYPETLVDRLTNSRMKRASIALPADDSETRVYVRKTAREVRILAEDYEVNELIETEENYVEILLNGLKNYGSIFQRHNLPQALRGKKYVLLRNLDQIAEFNHGQVLPMLRKHRHNLAALVREFSNLIEENSFYCYVMFAMYSKESEDLYEQNKAIFLDFQEMFSDRLGVSSLLLQPIQRSTRYVLLFQSILEKLYHKDKEGNLSVMELLSILLKKLNNLNNAVNEAIVIGKFFNTNVFYEAGLSLDITINDGQFHKSTVFAYVQEFLNYNSNQSSSKLMDLISRKKTYCRLFLFTHSLYIFGLESKDKDSVLKCYRYDRSQVTTMTHPDGLRLFFKDEEYTITLLDTKRVIPIWLELIRRHWLCDNDNLAKGSSPVEKFQKQFSKELYKTVNQDSE